MELSQETVFCVSFSLLAVQRSPCRAVITLTPDCHLSTVRNFTAVQLVMTGGVSLV